jgi:hypothetical protein
MNQWLNSGTEKQRIHRLVSLGVEHDTALLAVSERDIEWLPVRSKSENETAVLFFPCGAMNSAYLYVLKTVDNGDDVLVHHACEGHGTGFVQQNFNVLAVRSGKLKLVLENRRSHRRVADGWP